MSYKCIDKNDVAMLIRDNSCIIVDIRDSESFQKGHIKGAINLSNNNIDDFINSTDKDSNIIVCCYHGNSSKSAAKFLCEEGFINVSSLNGGYEKWKNNINIGS